MSVGTSYRTVNTTKRRWQIIVWAPLPKLVSPKSPDSCLELRIFLPHIYHIKVIYLPNYSITLHIPVGKARSTRFGFHISQIRLQKGTGHSLPLHFHTLFSVREKEKKKIKCRYIYILEEDFFTYILVLLPVDMKTYPL